MAAFSSTIFYCYYYYFSNETLLLTDIEKIIIYSFFPFLGQSIAGILEIIRLCIRKYQLKKKQNLSYEIKASRTKYIIKKSQYEYVKLIAILLLISMVNSRVIVFKSLYLINNSCLYYYTSLKIENIIFTTLLTVFCLPCYIYKHQYISIIIAILGIVPIIISNILYEHFSDLNNNSAFKLNFLIMIPIALLFSIQQIAEKTLIEKTFISQYLIMTIEGLFGLIVIGVITLSNMSCNHSIYTIISLSYIAILYFGMNTFRILTIIEYTPIHQVIGDSLSIVFTCFIHIIDYTDQQEPTFLIINSIGFALITIGFLIYFDIIIFNCLNMNTHTSKELSERGELFKVRLINDDDTFNISGI